MTSPDPTTDAVGRRPTHDDLLDALLPVLTRLEQRRRRYIRDGIGGAVVTGLVTMGLSVMLGDFELAWAVGAGASTAAAMLAAAAYGGTDSYIQAYKGEVVGRLVAHLAPGFKFEPKTVMLREDAKASGFLPPGHAYTYSEDLVEGQVEGRRLVFGELRASAHDHDAHGEEGQARAFAGLFFRVDLDAPVPDHVVAVPSRARLGAAAGAHDADTPGAGRPVAFADPAFGPAFQVFAQDPDVARAVLRPAVREALAALALEERHVYAAWRGRSMYLGLGRARSWLEPSFWKAAPSRSQLARFAAELEAALAAVRRLPPETFAGLDAPRDGAVGRL